MNAPALARPPRRTQAERSGAMRARLATAAYEAIASGGLKGLILLETNTQPGMTPTSLAPEQAAYRGITFPQLCDWIVKDASCNR